MRPQPHRLILPPTPHPTPITTPIHRENLILVARQILHHDPARHIPRLQRGILARANQQPRVRAEAALIHRPHVAPQRAQELAVAGAPQFDVVVEAARGDEAAVRGEGDVVDLLLVAEEAGDGLGEGERVPEEDGAVVAGGHEAFAERGGRGGGGCGCGFLPAAACEGSAGFGRGGWGGGVVEVAGAQDEVGREREVVHPMRVAGQVGELRARRRVPHFHRLVVGGGEDGAGAAPLDA